MRPTGQQRSEHYKATKRDTDALAWFGVGWGTLGGACSSWVFPQKRGPHRPGSLLTASRALWAIWVIVGALNGSSGPRVAATEMAPSELDEGAFSALAIPLIALEVGLEDPVRRPSLADELGGQRGAPEREAEQNEGPGQGGFFVFIAHANCNASPSSFSARLEQRHGKTRGC